VDPEVVEAEAAVEESADVAEEAEEADVEEEEVHKSLPLRANDLAAGGFRYLYADTAGDDWLSSVPNKDGKGWEEMEVANIAPLNPVSILFCHSSYLISRLPIITNPISSVVIQDSIH